MSTSFAPHPETIAERVSVALRSQLRDCTIAMDEVTITVAARDYHNAAHTLRHHADCQFEQLIDLCGVDYSSYREGEYEGPRFALVLHLLSVSLNQRVRLVVYASDDAMPMFASVTDIWTVANWLEREAFDMFGMIFEGHDDLRRILTDYGFIGHPLRKDFPTTGHVEMIYDEATRRVVYQPVSIEPREITPRIIRDDNYGGAQHG